MEKRSRNTLINEGTGSMQADQKTEQHCGTDRCSHLCQWRYRQVVSPVSTATQTGGLTCVNGGTDRCSHL